MPVSSRNERRKRRLRRNVTLVGRQLRHAQTQQNKAVITLLAVLAQKGGDVTITAGTMQQVLEKLSRLGYRIDKSPTVEGEFSVKLVEQEEPANDQGTADSATSNSGAEANAALGGYDSGPEAHTDSAAGPDGGVAGQTTGDPDGSVADGLPGVQDEGDGAGTSDDSVTQRVNGDLADPSGDGVAQ